MKTGEKWKRGDLSAIAVVFAHGSIRMVNANKALDSWYATSDIAVERGWVKTHEADGTPVLPKPKPGELWETVDDVVFVTEVDGTAITGVTKYGDLIRYRKPTRRLYPPMEESK